MRPIILALAEVFLPGHLAGGPIRSIAGLVEHLSDDFEWKIVTTNRDYKLSVPYQGIAADCWTRLGQAEVWYASAYRDGAAHLLRLIRDTPHDLLYLNSFFSPRFSITPALALYVGWLSRKPLLIAPRGEFSLGALAIKGFRKAAFLRLVRALRLYRNAHWHASSLSESSDMQRVFGSMAGRMHVAANLAPLRISVPRVARITGSPLRLCFLSRISRMKNLDFALRVLAQVQSAVQFTIVGPREDPRYWKECEALLADLPNHIRVIDAGPVVADDVPGVLAAQDLFFLPTRGENYGHALVEAWCAGLPVLTSDQTPWRNLETKGVGWDIPLDTPEAFVGIIDLVARWTSTAAEAVHQRCAAFGVDVATDLEAVDANRSMLDSLCNQGGGPGGQDGHDMHCEREDHGVV